MEEKKSLINKDCKDDLIDESFENESNREEIKDGE